jgi:acetoacetyl-CoA reductase/3-oxoacyl-[acyl-carrier protein] reductase
MTPCRLQFDFHGQLALVTGASRGIGRTIADELAVAGADVHCFDIEQPTNCPHGFSKVDISEAAEVNDAVAALPAAPSLLVNNAGITRDRTLAKMSDEEWAAVLGVNLTGAFNMIRAVAPGMAARGFGRIVSITSINGLRGKFGQANYAASKAGLIGLTKTAAKEFGKKGVTVNAVAPGMVLTEMARSVPPEVTAQARHEAALAALAEPEDIARAVLFLLSDGGRAITGEVLRVDAGQYI